MGAGLRDIMAPHGRAQAPRVLDPDGRGKGSTSASDDVLLEELVTVAGDAGRHGLDQFRTLVAAHQYRGLYDLFRKRVPPGAEVLDWGSGNGHFSYFLLRSGYRVCAFALHDEGFGTWAPAGPYRFVPGDPSDPVKLPFADASFDAVSSVGVLEHVRETGGAEALSLGEIARVLRPGAVNAKTEPQTSSGVSIHLCMRKSTSAVRGPACQTAARNVTAITRAVMPQSRPMSGQGRARTPAQP